MVHAYLMYGFPTETVQETVDSLEVVRQLFEADIVQSAFWHQFSLTAHSPVGLDPDKYNIQPQLKEIHFANNDVDFVDATGIDHTLFSQGLRQSLFNYMHAVGFDMPLQEWFDFDIPETTVHPDFIYNSLQQEPSFVTKDQALILYLGHMPLVEELTKKKKKQTFHSLELTFHDKRDSLQVSLDKAQGEWLLEVLEQLSPWQGDCLSYAALKEDYEKHFEDFELFWYSKSIMKLKAHGLLVL